MCHVQLEIYITYWGATSAMSVKHKQVTFFSLFLLLVSYTKRLNNKQDIKEF